MTGTRRVTMLLLPAILFLLGACSDDPLTPPEGGAERIPAQIEIISGQDQVAIAGEALPTALEVQVLDEEGRPVGNQVVIYQVTSGAGDVQSDTVLTNSDGIAYGKWILGPEPGENLLEARLMMRGRILRRPFARFRARGVRKAQEGRATAIEIVSGQNQRGAAGAELPEPLKVKVLDSHGRVIEGQEVQYRVTEGAGSLSARRAITDEEGIASVRLTLGDRPGRNTVVATIGGWSNKRSTLSVDFTAIATADTTTPPDEPGDPGTPGGGGTPPPSVSITECANPQPGWIWCDDFEENRLGQYFEYDDANGGFIRAAGVGIDGSSGMRVRFSRGQVNAGSLKLAFGATPQPYFEPVDRGRQKYREIYWRFYVRNAPNWTGGGGDKLTRAASMASRNSWAEAMIAHLWSGGRNHDYLVIDPASGTDTRGNLRTTRYNDFDNLRWLGAEAGRTPIFDRNHVGEWYCVEVRARLNDAGRSNGVLEYWIDDQLEARREGLNWVGSFDEYGINAIFLENYWNDGAPQVQERYIDNLVVSTQRIGCGDGAPGSGTDDPKEPAPPTPLVTTITTSPSEVSIEEDESVTLTATVRDQYGRVMSDKRVTWRSSDTGVARVSSTGQLTGRIEAVSAGSATITAEVDGKSARVRVTVKRSAVVELPPTPGRDPMPGSSDRILFDARTTLQQATSESQAKSLFVYTSGNIHFTPDVDGRGTKALRADYNAYNGRCSDTGAQMQAVFPTPAPKELYIQYKTLIGRTPTGGGVGQIGRFQITNPNCGTGGNAGAKRLLVTRDVTDQGNRGRTDLLWPGPAPAIPRMAIDTENWSAGANLVHIDPQEYQGQVMVWTVYYRAESRVGARDGVIRAWFNGDLIMEHTNVPLRPEGFRAFSMPATFNSPMYDQSEYFWDIVAWEPRR